MRVKIVQVSTPESSGDDKFVVEDDPVGSHASLVDSIVGPLVGNARIQHRDSETQRGRRTIGDFARVADASKRRIGALNEAIDASNDPIDGFNGPIDGMNEGIDGLNEAIDGINEAIDGMNAGVDGSMAGCGV